MRPLIRSAGCALAALLLCAAPALAQQQIDPSVLYRPRVLGQWFDGIRIYAAASSPPRSRRTRAGLR